MAQELLSKGEMYVQLQSADSVAQANADLREIPAVHTGLVTADTHEHVQVRSQFAMGTAFTVYVFNETAEQCQACFDVVFEEIDRIENTFSRFRSASEISRINGFAAEQPVVTDPEVFNLLACALDISAKTRGAFDITVGPLTRAWGFADKHARVPSAQQIEAARKSVGWANVVLDPAWRTVSFLKTGVELDLGGIAKGYAVERALVLMRDAGVSAIIDAGSSSVAATGIPAGNGWKVLLAHPADRHRTIAETKLCHRAVSTSGTYEQYFVDKGQKYCHVIDPRSADAKAHVLQVTMLAPNSTLADALSTAMFVLGPEEGIPVLNNMSGCSALWVCESGADVECISHQWSTGTV